MRNYRNPSRKKVRIDFNAILVEEASCKARFCGETLSQYVERLISQDLYQKKP